MPGLTRCQLHIPFKNALSELRLRDGTLTQESLDRAASQDFDNWKALERWANFIGPLACDGGGRTTLVQTTIAQGVDGTNRSGVTPYTTQAFSRRAGYLYLIAFVYDRGAGTVGLPGITQAGHAWTEVDRIIWSANDHYTALFCCQPATDIAAATASIGSLEGSGCNFAMWDVIEYAGAFQDIAGNGLGAIPETVTTTANATGTSMSISLASTISAPDLIYSCCGVEGNASVVVGTDFTEIVDETVENHTLQTQQKLGVGDGTASCSWGLSGGMGGIAAAILAA